VNHMDAKHYVNSILHPFFSVHFKVFLMMNSVVKFSWLQHIVGENFKKPWLHVVHCLLIENPSLFGEKC